MDVGIARQVDEIARSFRERPSIPEHDQHGHCKENGGYDALRKLLDAETLRDGIEHEMKQDGGRNRTAMLVVEPVCDNCRGDDTDEKVDDIDGTEKPKIVL